MASMQKKLLDPCYVCERPPIGLIRGMPSCAACRKFITRHRYISLSSLRCEAGGANANKCDMSNRRTCTKCRLRRSIELNPLLRKEIESRLPHATQEVADVEAHENHIANLSSLRAFLSKKQIAPLNSSDQEEGDGSDNINCRHWETEMSGSDGNSMSRKLSEAQSPPSNSSESAQVDMLTSSGMSVNLESLSSCTKPDDDPNPIWWKTVISAVQCIPVTYEIFVNRFIEMFQLCSIDECFQVLILINEQSGSEKDNENWLAAPIDHFSPGDLWSAFNIYSSVVMGSQGLTRAIIISTIRANPCFAYLAKYPLKMVAQLACAPSTENSAAT